ncbi:DUF6412 domain-containing protein [Streptomyces sp. NBC_01571]|uniref:DUF6412 domain-containing protein n=1 Tax=unclassified Streptomyces TaxID=2593676 RepID=UPI002256220F|nr:DUF6412 domain-containing protein [Streptomyces sp. NBC_01571]MCX4575215.1 DUF6412 domain-containing protein [Streptomyces sp. NBC_01571]
MIRRRATVRSAVASFPHPLPLVVLFLAEVVLLDAGGLSAAVAVAFAATTAVGSALAVCAVLAARCAPVVPRTRVRTALRDREHRTAFLPQRDPDAAGRSRPRAPGTALPATTA